MELSDCTGKERKLNLKKKNYTPSVNGFGILKRVSFSVSKSSLCNSEVQMFLISVLLSHWYLLEGTKISRVYEFLISRHD